MRQPLPFGKYLLLERISVGGMAEVFKAKAFGVEGFEKILAIKRILPSMAEDADFIQMFIDEAKICGQLNHGNICQTFELGRIDDSHFIAMEYIWGKDLLQIQNRFRRIRKTMPPNMAAFIASKVCEGLDYAHRKKDATGRPLGIIHRDVSPQNILVSYEGEIKVIDFGIAKAASRSSKTQAGVLKGKFGYMSPEHVRGMLLDRRSDIFSIGTILYEILTNERLFLGESDFATLEKVRNVDVPFPSVINREIPPVLDQIIMKALAKEAEDRFQWASEMQEALANFLTNEEPVYNSKALSTWMREQFNAEMRREAQVLEEQRRIGREAMHVLGQPRSAAPPSTKLRPPTIGTGIPTVAPRMPPMETSVPSGPPRESEVAPVITEESLGSSFEAELSSSALLPADSEDEPAGEKTSISMPASPDEVGSDLPTESTHILSSDSHNVTQPEENEITASPTVVFSQESIPSQTPPTSIPALMWPNSQSAGLSGHAAVQPAMSYGTGSVSSQPAHEPGVYGAELVPGTGMVMLPSGGYSSTVGGPHGSMRMGVPGGNHMTFGTPPNALWKDILVGVIVAILVVSTVLGLKFLLSPGKGTIVLTILPPRIAEVSLDGKVVGKVQPGGSLFLPDVLRGTRRIYVRAEDGEAQQLINIVDSKPVLLTVQLTPNQPDRILVGNQGSGKIRLRLPSDGALVSIDGRLVSEKELQKGYSVAANMPHEVRVSKAGKRDVHFTMTVGSGEERERQVEFSNPWGKLIINTEPPGADVSVDNLSRGKTPLTVENLEPNKQIRVVLRKRGYSSITKYVTFDSNTGYDHALDIKLTSNSSVKIDVSLKEPILLPNVPKQEVITTGEDGYLVANTKPWAKVFIDGKDTNKTTPIAPRDRISLRPGKHVVTFVANQKKFNFDIIVRPGEVKKLIQELSDTN